jgi:hypothetical protein
MNIIGIIVWILFYIWIFTLIDWNSL